MFTKMFAAVMLLVCVVQVTSSKKSFQICEWAKPDGKKLSCPEKYKLINIVKAIYGRKSTSICPRGYHRGVKNCGTASSFTKAKQLCNGKKTCTLRASNSMFGDPCWGINKYLDVTYECTVPNEGSFQICEHAKPDDRKLSCPQNYQTINIVKAIYGRKTTSICSHAKHGGVTNCGTSSSFTKAKKLCNGKKRCTLKAANSMFGDPCVGINKYLDVTYECTGDKRVQCEENGVDYYGNDIKQFPNTDSWQICSSHCRALLSCKAWTWVTETYPTVGVRKKCFLKSGDSGRKSLSGAISGSRKCGETVQCEENGVDYFGKDIKQFLNTDSWQICSYHCRALPSCTVWTWITETFRNVGIRKKCYLKSGGSGRSSLSGSISGSRKCGKIAVNWRSDGRCGPKYLLPNGKVAACSPYSKNSCCSDKGWCGKTKAHCECNKCVRYKAVNWRSDGRCGSKYLLPNGKVSECNPSGVYPCCSDYGWCGKTKNHCECAKCVHYRPNQGDMITYKIAVKTGSKRYAGTNANVFIIIYGEKGDTGRYILRNSKTNSDKFEANQLDLFTIKAIDVGKITMMRIGHDNKGARSGWFLDNVVITVKSCKLTFSVWKWVEKKKLAFDLYATLEQGKCKVPSSGSICRRDFRKIGCFSRDLSKVPDLVITDLDPTHKNYTTAMNWGNYAEGLHSLACRCRAKAVGHYKYFGIGFHAECVAGKDSAALEKMFAAKKGDKGATGCINGKRGTCDKNKETECAGAEDFDYFYEIVE